LGSKTRIRIDFPTNADGSLTHQIRNLGEDPYREIEVAGFADFGGPASVDAATIRLEAMIHRSSLIGPTRALGERIIARHLLTDRAVVTFEA
jgi:hypothetical protein